MRCLAGVATRVAVPNPALRAIPAPGEVARGSARLGRDGRQRIVGVPRVAVDAVLPEAGKSQSMTRLAALSQLVNASLQFFYKFLYFDV
jgi:hypothetical protein